MGVTGYAELDLAPGTYVAICNIHSPKADGYQHFSLGMIKTFTVGSIAGSAPGSAPGSAASSSFPIGKFIKSGTTDYGLVFNPDGTFSAFEGDTKFVNATYTAEGNVFTETSNDGGCETDVSFTYTFDGANLTCNYAGDPADDVACAGRHADFNNVTYTLSSFPTGKFIKSGTTDYGLVFNPDGTFSAFEGDTKFVNATYTAEGNVFTETSNDGGCETDVSFTYTFDGANLTFSYAGNPADDVACAGRHADFNNVTYTLSQ
jgi:hypothetical protein